MLSTHSHSAPAARGVKGRVVDLENAVEIYGGDGIVAEVVTITPEVASQWLKANTMNRPVRRKQVAFYADEIKRGDWVVNGQAIVIAENEDILDGQHRLLAVIDAGCSIQSLVVYGVDKAAFATMDTGIARSGTDALVLNFRDMPVAIVQATAVAAQWCTNLERLNIRSKIRLSNTDIIKYVQKHPSLFQCAETLASYPKEARPLSLGIGTALYEIFSRKKEDLADRYMRSLYTGENLQRTDVEYLLRTAFQKDALRTAKFSAANKVRMVVKGWNWRRRGMDEASPQTITIRNDDDQRIKIL